MTATPVFEARGLSPRYGNLVVAHNVDLMVMPGELLALIGPNGAGKSSLMELIAGRVAGGGTIHLSGRPIHGLPAHKRVGAGLAFIPEERGLFGDLTVMENLELGAIAGSRERRSQKDLLELFPVLEARLRQQAGTLSGGEQQMLAIARALASEPELLVIDEPTQGLAPVILDQIAEVLGKLRDSGLSILLVEQSVGFAARIADTYSVLSGGRISISRGFRDDLQDAELLFQKYLGD